MKISDLELFYLQPRWLFLKISTDEGICGWGEPANPLWRVGHTPWPPRWKNTARC